jgi:hypothetical protein
MQVANTESEKAKVEAARDTALSAEKSSQKREEELMVKVCPPSFLLLLP